VSRGDAAHQHGRGVCHGAVVVVGGRGEVSLQRAPRCAGLYARTLYFD
jgi:hypothetical protein